MQIKVGVHYTCRVDEAEGRGSGAGEYKKTEVKLWNMFSVHFSF